MPDVARTVVEPDLTPWTATLDPVDVSIVTISVSELVHVTVLFAAFVGKTVAVNTALNPARKLRLLGEIITLDTGIVDDTVTAVDAVKLPLTVVTEIVALPADTAVATPELLTDTLAPSDVLHVTDLFVAFVGYTVATKVYIVPTVRVRADGIMVTDVTGTNRRLANRLVPEILPNPVQLSYPTCAVNAPLLPDVISW